MAQAILIGDRLTTAGFRLAGMRVLVTEPADAGPVLREALEMGGPVMITAALAAHVPTAQLEKAILAADPPLAVIPDIARSREPADMGAAVRRALGVEA
jgi:vacuolar-type H+-ATPase subunit F/Vma7